MLHAHQGGAAHTHTFIGDPAHSPHLPHSPHSVCVVPRCTCAPLASLTAVRRTPGARRVSSQVNRSCSIVGCRLHPRLRMLNSWPLTLDNRPLVPWTVGPSGNDEPHVRYPDGSQTKPLVSPRVHYFTFPTRNARRPCVEADVYVGAFRKWIKEMAGGSPAWPKVGRTRSMV